MDSNFATAVEVTVKEVALAHKGFCFGVSSFTTAKLTEGLAILLPRAKCGLPYIDATVTDPTYATAQEAVKTAIETQIKNLMGAELVSGLQIV
jgi:hypothetical protein